MQANAGRGQASSDRGPTRHRGLLSDYIYQLAGGLIESHPHDITITREAPNYQRGSD